MTKWHKYWTRDYTYHYIENCLASFTILLNKLKIMPLRHILFIRKDGLFSIHSYASERQRFDREITGQFASSRKALNRLKAILMERARNYSKRPK